MLSLISFLFSEEKINNNASFTLSTGISPLDITESLFSGIFLSLLGFDSEIESKGINFNYKFHSNNRLSYGLCSSYHQINEIFYDENKNVISEQTSHYYIAGPMVYFNWRKESKIMDISTNLGVCFIYANKPDGYENTSTKFAPQFDLMSIQLGKKHSLNINFGLGIQYLFSSIGYTHKF